MCQSKYINKSGQRGLGNSPLNYDESRGASDGLELRPITESDREKIRIGIARFQSETLIVQVPRAIAK